MKKTSKTTSSGHYTRDAMDAIASALSGHLRPGSIITLDGPLGSGKTTFTQALCAALNITEAVTSPSFGLVNEYVSGNIHVAHLDLYRLGPEKAHQLWDELSLYLDENKHITLIEWACYAENFPIDLYEEADAVIHFNYSDTDPDSRNMTLDTTLAYVLP